MLATVPLHSQTGMVAVASIGLGAHLVAENLFFGHSPILVESY